MTERRTARATRHRACCASSRGGLVAALATSAFAFAFAREAAAAPSTTSIEQGYDLGQVPHPRAVALGDAVQVWGGSTTAVFYNPANLALYRVYHIEGLAAFGPEARRQTYGGAVVDSSTSRLAGGFGGTWSQMDPDGIKRQWTDLRLTLAYPLGDRVSLGATGRYLRVNQAVNRGPFGTSLASSGTPNDPLSSQFTFDAGAAVAITEQLRVAVSGRNLTAPGTGLMPLAVAGGLGWSNQIVSVEADTLVDFTTYNSARGRAMVGGEVLLADHVPLRLGYRYDAGVKSSNVGLGAGYVERRFSIEVGARRDVGADHPATLISVGLRIFIDSAGTSGGPGQDSPDAF
jgi:hypothetical protein